MTKKIVTETEVKSEYNNTLNTITSEEMAKRIAKTLGLPEIEKFIKIEDIKPVQD